MIVIVCFWMVFFELVCYFMWFGGGIWGFLFGILLSFVFNVGGLVVGVGVELEDVVECFWDVRVVRFLGIY